MGGQKIMNSNCPLKYLVCNDHCKYFRVLEKRPKALRITRCAFQSCHEFPLPEGKPPEECFEGTANADECERLEKGQYWDECPHGGGWKR